jgi:hypothetical protein
VIPSVYIAAPFGCWREAKAMAAALKSRHHIECESSWIAEAERLGGVDMAKFEMSRVDLVAATRANAVDLDRASLFVGIAGSGSAGRETYVELGRALEQGVPVVWCGPWFLSAHAPTVVRCEDSIEGVGAVYRVLSAAVGRVRRVDDAWDMRRVIREIVADGKVWGKL